MITDYYNIFVLDIQFLSYPGLRLLVRANVQQYTIVFYRMVTAVLITLCSQNHLPKGKGGHYAMKPSVILKHKNPAFSKLPS